MSKIAQWKKIFGQTRKQKVMVQVSGKTEALTATQMYRFEELAKTRETGKFAAGENPLEDSKYGPDD